MKQSVPLLLPDWALTLVVVLAILAQRYDQLERLIVGFLAFIATAYIIELFIVKPDMAAAAETPGRARIRSVSWRKNAASFCVFG